MFKLIKHRGFSNKDIKENTYEGILLALNDAKYMGVEFDVRETLDKEFIIFHDSLYNGKLVSQTLYKDMPKYVPKLSDILNINSAKIFLIEIKNITSFNLFTKMLVKYHDKNLYIMSFSGRLIKNMALDNRKYKIGILNYVLNTNYATNDLDFVCILNSLLNDNIINILKGKEVFSYGLGKKMTYPEVYYIVN